MINPQDWAALSDAFAHQLRIQEERSAAARNAAIAAAEQAGGEPLRDDARHKRSRTYLELRDAMRTETELILKSRRVAPGRLLASGFEFELPDWRSAAEDLSRRWRETRITRSLMSGGASAAFASR